MITHLTDHQKAGHRVPEESFEGLLAEQADNDAEAKPSSNPT